MNGYILALVSVSECKYTLFRLICCRIGEDQILKSSFVIPREVGIKFWSLETNTVRTVCHITLHVPQECPVHLTMLMHLDIPTHILHVRDHVGLVLPLRLRT